ncbi:MULTISPECIES: IpI internal head protein [Bacteria]|uniref:Internal protein I n=27 Tax=root TaxID=1 RepID=IPI1_BPT4|nr:IpI internal head protein [Escherichia coli]NP_049749.1 internal virion protein [Escherichia phage T4]YP_002854476.1 internal virion protein [Escherichia phage RB14]YP_009098525.1 internal virion protein [Escherichia phage RB3]YP_009180643.1 internal virion protein [Escherichia phage slur14]YP_009281477.1 internal virion protein [Escherichia phage UFV-AREG1]YP_009614794.1 internal virion protein [Shigella phage Sf22]YP_009625107.1 internal virion protein [Escherichia phage slur03]YP_0100
MKTFKEFTSTTTPVSTITEATLTSEVIKANKGREGKPMISLVDGEEIKGTVYLGDGWSAKKDGATIVISPAEETALFKAKHISAAHLKIIAKNLL